MAKPTTKMKTVLRRNIQVKKMQLNQLVKLQDELRASFSQSELTQKRIKEKLRANGIHSGANDEDLQKFADSINDAINQALDQLGYFLEVVNLLSDDENLQSGVVSEKSIFDDENESQLTRAEQKAQLEKSLKKLQRLLKGFQGVVVKLEAKKLPDPVTHSVNFIKNNKIPAPDDEEHKRVRLPLSIAEDLANTLNLMDKEMAVILTISVRTYHRLKPNGLLNPVASERLAMLKKLADYGLEVFENQDSFNQWLRLSLQELSNKSPLNSLETATGFNQVSAILNRIDYGVYS